MKRSRPRRSSVHRATAAEVAAHRMAAAEVHRMAVAEDSLPEEERMAARASLGTWMGTFSLDEPERHEPLVCVSENGGQGVN
jgi:hypothetical protein